MSQSQNPKDNQALLQSMLQRLKLQPARESQACLHKPAADKSASTHSERRASDSQKVNNNAFELGVNGTPTRRFGIFPADGHFSLKDGKRQGPRYGCEPDSGPVSSPSHKDNNDGAKGENRVLGQATLPGINHTGTEQTFPAMSLKDAGITSCDRTDGQLRVETGSLCSIAGDADNAEAMGQIQEQAFKPRVYAWSLKSTETDTGGQENKGLHIGNGESGALAQSKDTQNAQTSQNTLVRRNQRLFDNKTRRWTQKIKERWRERPGSKKGKEDEVQGTKISPQNQQLSSENLVNASNTDGEGVFPSLGSSDTSETPSAHSGDHSADGYIRPSSDFDFGLGSFSLLEEISTGQEWAKFLNPTSSTTSANQPSEELPSHLAITLNPNDSDQSSPDQQRNGNNQWSFRGSESSPSSDFSMAPTSPDVLPVSMDVMEGKQVTAQDVHSGADQSEPMEHGHSQSNNQSEERRHPRTSTFVKPADIQVNPALKSRVQLNRKRQHQSEWEGDGKAAAREKSMSSPSVPSSHMMEETGDSQHVLPSHVLNSPCSPSSSSPCGPAPRGVLKHSISQDSQSSMETLTKRRRVEENRRVHFSEEVLTIPLAELDMDSTVSDEDSGSEEASIAEQDFEDEQPATEEEAAPSRRPALPAWILALKRKNTGRKHR